MKNVKLNFISMVVSKRLEMFVYIGNIQCLQTLH